MLIPRKKTPDLVVPKIDGSTFDLAEENTERGTLVCFYRGLHCPICANYLRELERLTPEFHQRGVSTIAISSDQQDRAKDMAEKIETKDSLEENRLWPDDYIPCVNLCRIALLLHIHVIIFECSCSSCKTKAEAYLEYSFQFLSLQCE